MKSANAAPNRIRTATTLSIAGHLCALLVLAAIVHEPTALEYDVTHSGLILNGPILPITITAQRRLLSQRRAVRVFRPARPAVVPPRPDPRIMPRPAVAAGAAHASGARRAAARVSAGPGPARTVARHGLARRTPPGPALAPANDPPPPVPTRTVIASNTPAAPPTPLSSATPAAVAAANFGGLFSQDYPPALQTPGVIAAIRARIGGHFRIRIFVDESGHATDVRFIEPTDDASLAEVRAELLALDYVPADCNGLHCDGDFEIAH